MKIIFLSLVLILFGNSGYAQDKPNFITFIGPGDYYRVKIDGALQKATNRFLLTPGEHQITIWAPNYKRFDTTMTPGTAPITLRKRLKPTQILVDYRRAMINHNQWKRAKWGWLMSTCVSSVIATINFYGLSFLHLDLIRHEDGLKYNIPGYLEEERSSANFWLRTSQVFQGFLYANIGFSGYMLYKTLKDKEHRNKPVLSKDKSFFVSDFRIIKGPNDLQLGLLISF